MPTQYDIQQTQSNFHLCQSSSEKPRRSVELFHISFHICRKNLFQDRYFNKPLFQSAGFCLQIAQIKLWSRARGKNILHHDSLGQIQHVQLPLRLKYRQHLFPDNKEFVCCYWNRKSHELSSIIPLVRLASSTCVWRWEIIPLNNVFSISKIMYVATKT